MLGAGAPVPGGGGGPAAAITAGDNAPMLALPLSDAKAAPSGESNIISSGDVPGLLPGVPAATVEGSLVLVVVWVVDVVAEWALVEEAEEAEEDGETT